LEIDAGICSSSGYFFVDIKVKEENGNNVQILANCSGGFFFVFFGKIFLCGCQNSYLHNFYAAKDFVFVSVSSSNGV